MGRNMWVRRAQQDPGPADSSQSTISLVNDRFRRHVSHPTEHTISLPAPLPPNHPPPPNPHHPPTRSQHPRQPKRIPTSISPPIRHPPPPPDSTITVSSSTANIPQRACFALTITALTDLAALPFNAHFDTAKTAISAHFPGVRLRFAGPHDQGGLDVKYAVWGLTKAIRHMVEQYAYRESRFTLFWQGIAVGTVQFIKSSPGGAGDTRTIGANTTLPTRNQTQTLLPVNNQSEDGSLGDSLTYSATFVGRPIAFLDAMMAIIGGLTLTAVNDKDAWVDSRVFSGFFHSYGCKFVLVTPAIAPQPYYHVKSGLMTAMLQAAGMFYIFRSESREQRAKDCDCGRANHRHCSGSARSA